jgi:hypothetical protein
MSASLIGGSGSSAFKLSMSLAGSCFSSESAHRPFHLGFEDKAARRDATVDTVRSGQAPAAKFDLSAAAQTAKPSGRSQIAQNKKGSRRVPRASGDSCTREEVYPAFEVFSVRYRTRGKKKATQFGWP